MLKRKTQPRINERSGDLLSWSQMRRCHRCLEVHETEGGRVSKCTVCGASFAPYFFAELTPEALLQSGQTPFVKPRSLISSKPKSYRPIVGVTWWWTESSKLGLGELLMPRA